MNRSKVYEQEASQVADTRISEKLELFGSIHTEFEIKIRFIIYQARGCTIRACRLWSI